MIKQIIIATLFFTILINTIPYIHIKKDNYIKPNIGNNKIEKYDLLKSDIQKDIIEELPETILQGKEVKIEPKWFNIRVSYYTNSKRNCGKTDGISKSGKNLIELSRGGTGLDNIHYIAAPDSVPFGTRIYVEGIGECIALDRGSAIKMKNNVMWIDVFVADASQKELEQKGILNTRGYVIEK